MLRFLLLALAATGCVDPGAEPRVTYHLDIVDQDVEAESWTALQGWALLGLARADLDQPADVATIRVVRVPDAMLPDADGRTWKEDRLIQIRESLVAPRLWTVLAHEVGHGVLYTGEHTTHGIMHGDDWFPSGEDGLLACERLPALCQ